MSGGHKKNSMGHFVGFSMVGLFGGWHNHKVVNGKV